MITLKSSSSPHLILLTQELVWITLHYYTVIMNLDQWCSANTCVAESRGTRGWRENEAGMGGLWNNKTKFGLSNLERQFVVLPTRKELKRIKFSSRCWMRLWFARATTAECVAQPTCVAPSGKDWHHQHLRTPPQCKIIQMVIHSYDEPLCHKQRISREERSIQWNQLLVVAPLAWLINAGPSSVPREAPYGGWHWPPFSLINTIATWLRLSYARTIKILDRCKSPCQVHPFGFFSAPWLTPSRSHFLTHALVSFLFLLHIAEHREHRRI